MLLATTTKWNSPDKNMEDRNMERRGKGRRYGMLRAFRGIAVPGQAKTWAVGVPARRADPTGAPLEKCGLSGLEEKCLEVFPRN